MLNHNLDAKRSLTFSLDTLTVGFYLWIGDFCLRIGGVNIKDFGEDFSYPYLVPTFIGFGIVLPNYIHWHTPFGEYKHLVEIVETPPKVGDAIS